MFEISVVYNKYEGDKDHPVPMDYIGVSRTQEVPD